MDETVKWKRQRRQMKWKDDSEKLFIMQISVCVRVISRSISVALSAFQ